MVFMFIMYHGRHMKERYFILLMKLPIEKIPMLLLSKVQKMTQLAMFHGKYHAYAGYSFTMVVH